MFIFCRMRVRCPQVFIYFFFVFVYFLGITKDFELRQLYGMQKCGLVNWCLLA